MTDAPHDQPRAFTLAARPGLCIAALCLLYAAQGMPDRFVRVGLKAFLFDRGVSTQAVGLLIAAISWPWAVKWIWGPIIDRFSSLAMGRRRPWILAAEAGMVAMLTGLLLLELLGVDVAANLELLAVMVVTVNVFAAMQDVAVDATAVDLLPESKRGLANGLMQAALAVGGFVGGQVLGSLLVRYGLATALAAEIGVLLLVMSVPLLLRERATDAWLSLTTKEPPRVSPNSHHEGAEAITDAPVAPVTTAALFARLFRAFSVRSAWVAAVFALLSSVTHGAYLVVWIRHLKDGLGWTSPEVITLESTYAIGFEVAGALVGGVVVSRLGTRRTVAVATVLLALVWGGHAAADWSNRSIVTALYLTEIAAIGFLNVSMFSLFMTIAWPPVAATQFSAYMAMLNLSQGLGSAMAGAIENAMAPSAMFVLLAGLQLATLGLLAVIDPHQLRRELGDTLIDDSADGR